MNQKIERDERKRCLIAAIWNFVSCIGRVDSDEGRFARGFRKGMVWMDSIAEYNLQKVVEEWATRGISMHDMSIGSIQVVQSWLKTEQEKRWPHDSYEHKLLTGFQLDALKDDAQRFLCEWMEKNVKCPYCNHPLGTELQSEDAH